MSKRQGELFDDHEPKVLELADVPALLEEWHPTKNGNTNPNSLHIGSHRKVWWQCSYGHEWETELRLRTRRDYGCPYCKQTKPSAEYNLGILRPDLIQEWNYELNDADPQDYTPNSGKKVWWKCGAGHSWKSTIDSRNRGDVGSNCPYCAGKRASAENNLSKSHPLASQEWDYEKNYPLQPQDVLPSSNKRAWWLCAKGHSYQAVIHAKVVSQASSAGCPYCSNKKVNSENNLQVLHPKLSAEWNPKNKKTPADFVPGSNQKIWWVCSRGHEWKTSIAHRALNGRGCPYCTNQSSRNELRLLAELETLSEVVKHRTKLEGFEYDVCIESEKVLIEYDGSYWHADKTEQDMRKTVSALQQGYRIIRVRETPLEPMGTEDVIVDKSEPISKEQVNQLVKAIFGESNVYCQYAALGCFANETRYLELLEAYPSPQFQRSYAASNSPTFQEWHPSKNGELTPAHFGPSSKFIAWWKCARGHEWQASIVARNKQGSHCKACQSIVITRSELLDWWHPSLNKSLKPSDVSLGSRKQVVWRCKYNTNHVWKQSVKEMAGPRKQTPCPYCRPKKNKQNTPPKYEA